MLGLSFLGTTTTWLLCAPRDATGWLLLALIAGIHLAGAGMWLALVAFSEYLARVHEQVLGRPLYVVRETSDDVAERNRSPAARGASRTVVA